MKERDWSHLTGQLRENDFVCTVCPKKNSFGTLFWGEKRALPLPPILANNLNEINCQNKHMGENFYKKIIKGLITTWYA